MKLVFFDDFKLGVLNGDRVVDAARVVADIRHDSPQDLLSKLIGSFDRYRARLEEAARSGAGVPVASVRLRSPLPKPLLVCMAVNYMEYGTRAEPSPINAFLKSSDSVIGPGDTIVLPPDEARIFEHEAELGLVIGKTAKNVKAADAYDYIFGYVNFIDVSSRGLGGNSFFWGKSWDTFGPTGPALVTADEIKDPQNLNVRLWVNGVLRQDYPTSDMAHKIPRVVEWASSVATLEPGDLIATGTNHQGLGPLQDGDVMEMEIDGLGRLAGLKVVDAKKRSWPRETRAQKAAREASA
ncbi:MAG: fumarylacetoacetate hydrolase family protein [Chloroflexi bacterium]|nr:fumarylacetoacetate hydrolase family protein [Chloroflexota bacterium]